MSITPNGETETQPSFSEVVAEIFEVMDQAAFLTKKDDKDHRPLTELIDLALTTGGTRSTNAEIMIDRLVDHISFKAAVQSKNGGDTVGMVRLLTSVGAVSEILLHELEPRS